MAEAEVEEAKGRIRFRLEYDFTLQELKVTVRKIFFLKIINAVKSIDNLLIGDDRSMTSVSF